MLNSIETLTDDQDHIYDKKIKEYLNSYFG